MIYEFCWSQNLKKLQFHFCYMPKSKQKKNGEKLCSLAPPNPKNSEKSGNFKILSVVFYPIFYYITRLANLSLVLPKDDIEKYDASNLLNCHWIKKYCILNTISSHFLYLLLYFLSWTNIILYVICKHSILFYYFFVLVKQSLRYLPI